MSADRVRIVEDALDASIAGAEEGAPLAADAPLAPGSSLTAARALHLFEDQLRSRVLDVVARELRATGDGFYTISSAGHEDDAIVGALTRPTDPAFLHYRSGGFVMARSRQAPDGADVDPLRDTLRSFVASREDPASGGRHKVWGSRPLWIPPQTSTIASHLPKAVGAAVAIGLRRRLGVAPSTSTDVPDDAIVVASFGDASYNHATALTAFNAARWAHRVGTPVPILFVCEDNGIGISVRTPADWVATSAAAQPGLTYVRASGSLVDVWAAVEHAVDTARSRRTPVFLHLETVRLWGHAGSDAEAGYRSRAEIEADEARDPLARRARELVAAGVTTRDELARLVATTRARVRELAPAAVATGRLTSAAEVMAPLAPHRPERITAALAARPLDATERRAAHGRRLPEEAATPGERTLAAHLGAALTDELLRRPETVLFGEDVAGKGGVYGVTSGLQARFGPLRVFDTLLDETAILGLAQGLGLLGLLPVPEIQYLAYVHNALDQLRGEACSTSFFSDGAFTTPMVVRIAGLGYQKGFGGHFHNDDSIGALRDIPGLALAVPSRGDDAVLMLRAALSMAEADGRVVAFLEPIALYHERDLLEAGDEGWLTDHPGPGGLCLPGTVRTYDVAADGTVTTDPDGAVDASADVAVITYGNGVRMALRAAHRLARAGTRARVIDLRWLAPLPVAAIEDHARAVGRVLVADECRATAGGIADAVVAHLAEHTPGTRLASVRSMDSYVPLGPAADLVLLGEDDIERAVRELAERTT